MKKFLLTLAAAAALLIMLCASASAQDIRITVNGDTVESDVAPIIINDRTMVPLRAVSGALKCAVGWDEEIQCVTLVQAPVGDEIDPHMILCWIGKNHAFDINGLSFGKAYFMESPPVIYNDRTLVPLRAISELLGARVDWNEQTRTVSITAELPEETIEDEVAEDAAGYGHAMLNTYDYYAAYAEGQARTVNVEIVLADGRRIDAELYPDLAPDTVENFVRLAREGKFDGTIFHRVIDGFVIQGGGFEPDGTERDVETIYGEFIMNGFLNLIPHKRGVLSMARLNNDPDSAGNQFFIVQQDQSSLDGMYAAFGRVTEGMEAVDEIASVPTDDADKPLVDQIIANVIVLE